MRALRMLREDPFGPRPKVDIHPIEGTDPRKDRMRVGDYRGVYAVLGNEVKVIEVFVRGRVYR